MPCALRVSNQPPRALLAQVLVRLSLACFRPGGSKVFDSAEGNWNEPVGAGQCLRALLVHVWRRLHNSAELALNGVRAGGLRHRSSIQKVSEAMTRLGL